MLVAAAVVIVAALFVGSERSLYASDFRPYLLAAHDVAHLRAPYEAGYSYPYPPLTALLVAPLLLVSTGLAEHVAVVFSLGCVLSALWLCRVTDLRCYALALLAAPTLLLVQLGNAHGLVLLLVAASWRWRSGYAAGASVAIKLLSWPLLVWLAAIRQGRAALLGIVSALLLILVPWTVIGFAGAASYPDVLADNNDRWMGETYSIVGSGLPGAWGAAVALTLLCLYGCWRRGRSGDDAGSFALAIGASLAFSPIVWAFSLSLLMVAIAGRYPRLHPVWFAPLALWPLENGLGVTAVERILAFAVVAGIVAWLSRPWPVRGRVPEAVPVSR